MPQRVPEESRGRALARKILDRIANDPAFRRTFMHDPEQALDDADLSIEIDELEAEALAPNSRIPPGGSDQKSCQVTCNATCKGAGATCTWTYRPSL
jgi:hypothetical protein